MLALALPGPAQAAEVPTIKAIWVTDVTSGSAVLRAEIIPGGAPTSFHFEYLTAAAYQQDLEAGGDGFSGARSLPLSNNNIGTGTTPRAVSVTLISPSNPLTAGTSYRYRVTAKNEAGPTVIAPARSFRTELAGTTPTLPDDRAWELVSPLQKNGGSIAAPETLFGGGLFQATPEGGGLTYSAATAFGEPFGAPPGSQYVSRRSGTGWTTQNISAPLKAGAYGDRPDGVPYRLLAADLNSAVLYGGDPCPQGLGCAPPLAGSGAPDGYPTYYLRSPAGAYTSLLTAGETQYTEVSSADFSLRLEGASEDFSSFILSTCAALTADAEEVLTPKGCTGSNLYRWRGGALQALNLLPDQAASSPGAALAAPIGAVSENGDRVYLYQAEDGPIYLREGSLSKALPGTVGAPASFQGSSADGRFAFYVASGVLHRFDALTGDSTEISPGAGVTGALGISDDGTRAYYQDASGLWLWQAGSARQEVAAGADASLSGSSPPSVGTAHVSPDARQLAFLSAAPIGEFDNADAGTGEPDTELYLYDATRTPPLLCVSCNPTGERPQDSASIPGALLNGSSALYRPRVLVDQGRRVFFTSSDDLLSSDTNSRPDVYQWERQGVGDCVTDPGCLGLISSGRGSGASYLDASASGDDVFFITLDSLVPQDPGSFDAYDARAGGGIPEPAQPIACRGDACQPLPSPPEDPTPGTSLPSSGNPAPKYFKEHQRKRHHRRQHKHKKQHPKHAHHGGRR
jgi:hypothetical protein